MDPIGRETKAADEARCVLWKEAHPTEPSSVVPQMVRVGRRVVGLHGSCSALEGL